MADCNCRTADRHCSGGTPLSPYDFTSEPLTHLEYSNWDEIYLFTCQICSRSWVIVNRYTDRPPFICHAHGIGEKGMQPLLAKKAEIEKAGLDALPSKYK